ncbi:MAG: 4Fe-4S binding protein [Peptococcaceae bacterium]
MNLREIKSLMDGFIKESSLNIVPELNNMRIFELPLLGVADARDPLFGKLKEPEAVGPHHLLPGEWFPGAVSVISYFLPFTRAVREANREDAQLPAREWLYARIEGEACSEALRRYIAEEVKKRGGDALVPALDPNFQVIRRRSNWSERHIAYIAGLGTFNLSKSFITAQGCAGRFGSIIVDFKLEPTPRRYQDIYEYCNNCGACIKRCPVAAIDETGKSHEICADFLDKVIKPKYKPRYGCGKCQTAVPCESTIPGRH